MTDTYAMLIDYEFCTGCHTCEVACKTEHGFGEGMWGIRLYDDGPWKKTTDPDDQGKNYNWNKVPVPTDLCDGCAERLAAGRKPSCAHHCLAEVITFGTVEELAPKLAEKPKQVMWTIQVP